MPGTRAPEAERRRQIVDAGLEVAARDRLDRLTVRNVAAEAGLSPGLVFHHLGDKPTLLLAVLDRLVELIVPTAPATTDLTPDRARERLLEHVRAEVTALAERGRLAELFLDFWVLGTREPEVRARIAEALRRYREALLPLARACIEDEPRRFADVDPDRLASVVVAFAHGLAVQAVLEPDAIDPAATMAALEALVPPGNELP